MHIARIHGKQFETNRNLLWGAAQAFAGQNHAGRWNCPGHAKIRAGNAKFRAAQPGRLRHCSSVCPCSSVSVWQTMQRIFPQRNARRRWVCAAAIGLALGLRSAHPASLPALARASWVWAAESDALCDLRKTFALDAAPTSATVLITADNGYELYVNGSLVGSEVGAASEIWQSVERYDITSRLAKGRNVIGIHG